MGEAGALKDFEAHYDIPHPPLTLTGRTEVNRSLFLKEHVNVLAWVDDPRNAQIAGDRIYLVPAPDETDLLTEAGPGVRQYIQRGIQAGSSVRHAVAAVDAAGREGMPAFVTVGGGN